MIQNQLDKIEQRGLEKGMEKGMEKGGIAVSQKNLLQILEARFGKISADVEEKILEIESMEKLQKLIPLAVTCESVEKFIAGLE